MNLCPLFLLLCAPLAAGISFSQKPLQKHDSMVPDLTQESQAHSNFSDSQMVYEYFKRNPEELHNHRGFYKEEEKLILFVGQYIGFDGQLPFCEQQCSYTIDRNKWDQASAVIWNAPWSNPGELWDKKDGQKFVFTYQFEPPNTWGGQDKTDSVNDRIDWTMTFNKKSDFHAPLFAFVKKGSADSSAVLPLGEIGNNAASGREHIVLGMISNCVEHRMNWVNGLQANLPEDSVHIFGNCGRGRFDCDGSDGAWHEGASECWRNHYGKYKFYLAFENQRCEGYVTEKPMRAFKNGMVPIVSGGLGREDYDAMGIPRDAYIHMDDFSSPEEMANFLKKLDNDDKAYNKYFDWRRNYDVRDAQEMAYCELCKEVHMDASSMKASRKFAANGQSLTSWHFDGTCRGY